MQIVETYSHLNGLEYLLVHKPYIWNEIKSVIGGVNAATGLAITKLPTKPARLLQAMDRNKSK